MNESDLLPVGEPAPAFDFHDVEGELHNTQEWRGQPFLVYFYPKDDTPGCTAQACGIRDSWDEFEAAGVAVVGVSFDSEQSHRHFRKRHRLPFALAADTDRAIAAAFGVYQARRLSHRMLPFARRVAFLIDKNGRVAQVYPRVNPAHQARQVLADASKLT